MYIRELGSSPAAGDAFYDDLLDAAEAEEAAGGVELAVKVVIVGDGAVGKSSLIQRYCRGTFTSGYKKTIGVDFLERHIRVVSQDVRLMLWDTAGQEEFDAITKAYYRGAQACVVAFSTTDRASFEAVRKWKRKVEDECGPIPMVLVQNKIDLMHQSHVDSVAVDALSRELDMRLFRTSVKEGVNVSAVFEHLAENFVDSVGNAFHEDYAGVADANNFYSRAYLPTMQIGVNPRSYFSASAINHPATANTNGRGRLLYTTSNNRQQQKQQQQQKWHQTKKKYKETGFHQHLHPQQNYFYGGFNGGGGGGGGGGGARGFTTPQDYLKNPMFDSLHRGGRRRGLSWPSSSSSSTDSATVITLGNLTRRGAAAAAAGHKWGGGRSPASFVGNCKVL